MDTKEVVSLMEKWLEQIKQITVNYTIAVSKLEKAQLDYEKQQKKWYLTILPYVMPLITAIVLLFTFVIVIKLVGCPNPIHFEWQGIQLSQTCTN